MGKWGSGCGTGQPLLTYHCSLQFLCACVLVGVVLSLSFVDLRVKNHEMNMTFQKKEVRRSQDLSKKRGFFGGIYLMLQACLKHENEAALDCLELTPFLCRLSAQVARLIKIAFPLDKTLISDGKNGPSINLLLLAFSAQMGRPSKPTIFSGPTWQVPKTFLPKAKKGVLRTKLAQLTKPYY